MADDIFSYLNSVVKVNVDRPLGSRHPKYDFLYTVNYGHLPGTKAPDGDELDVYVLGVDEPVSEFTGRCVAVIHRTDDNDDKLIVIPEDYGEMSDEKIKELTDFQEHFYNSVIMREEPEE
jgi:inorganic pyrophosphatase